VPPAEPQYQPKLFLRAIDRNEALRARLTEHKKQWTLLILFRADFGDSCSRTRGALSFLWSLELQRDKQAFFSILTGAKYGE
jgi:hypothetical protein